MPFSRAGKKFEIISMEMIQSQPGIMIQGLWYGPNAFFDWSTRKFVKTQPVQLIQPMELQTVPSFPGVFQRWTYDLSVSDFPDGDFAIYRMNANGGVTCYVLQPQYFTVYQGAVVTLSPSSPTGILT